MYTVFNQVLCRGVETQHNYTVRPLVECKYVHRDLAQWPKTYNWLVGFRAGNQQQSKKCCQQMFAHFVNFYFVLSVLFNIRFPHCARCTLVAEYPHCEGLLHFVISVHGTICFATWQRSIESLAPDTLCVSSTSCKDYRRVF